jgi:hypothetical protein
VAYATTAADRFKFRYKVTDINRSRSGSLNTSASAALLIRPMPLSPTRIAPVATLRQLDATIPVTKKRNTTEKFQ